ncbi:MAG: TlpA family protein disulfide reductase [Ruminococcaceae bacterium]|nr:TlpA family protein disulfide reductase [Oscillospiraceae bacterium]
MKKKITWIVLAVLLVALIGGASVLYDRLGSAYEVDQLATQAPVVPQTEVPAENEIPKETETPEETEAQAETEPMTAPDFTALDAQGNEVRLSDYFGKPIVLNFWASWCGPCKSEMPDFDEAYLAQGEEIQFLMVNMTDGSRETLDTAKSFVADSGYSFPVVFDVNQEAAMTYAVSSLPTTFFIGADGSMVAYAMGAIDGDTLQRGIEMITQ